MMTEPAIIKGVVGPPSIANTTTLTVGGPRHFTLALMRQYLPTLKTVGKL